MNTPAIQSTDTVFVVSYVPSNPDEVSYVHSVFSNDVDAEKYLIWALGEFDYAEDEMAIEPHNLQHSFA